MKLVHLFFFVSLFWVFLDILLCFRLPSSPISITPIFLQIWYLSLMFHCKFCSLTNLSRNTYLCKSVKKPNQQDFNFIMCRRWSRDELALFWVHKRILSWMAEGHWTLSESIVLLSPYCHQLYMWVWKIGQSQPQFLLLPPPPSLLPFLYSFFLSFLEMEGDGGTEGERES